MENDNKKLLTLGIPTYNRLNELDKALQYLLPQVIRFQDDIEFIIQDNFSSIDLLPVITKYRHLGMSIIYNKNTSNLGMDGNFSMLFENATGKYVWLLSDDDVVVERGVERIISILSQQELSSLFLSNLWFVNEIDFSKFDSTATTNFTIYNTPLDYLKRINYWVTFLSANIVNKDLVQSIVRLRENQGTYLALLDWILPAIFLDNPSAVLNNPILACSAKNQGGYRFVEVFAVNFNKIIDSYIKRGYPKEMKAIINNAMLFHYFPNFIIGKKLNYLKDISSYKKESWLKVFFKTYKRNKNFYVHVFPLYVLPHRYLNKWNSLVSRFKN